MSSPVSFSSPFSQRDGFRRFLALAVGLLVAGGAAAAVPNTILSGNGNIFYASNGRIYSVDTQLQRVEVVARTSASRLQVDANNVLYGRGLAYDAKLDLYRPAVWRVAGPGGSAPLTRPQADDFAYSDVCDREGNLYFWQHDARRGTSRIVMRAREGGLRLVAGQRQGLADGQGADAQLGQIGSMTVAADGTLYFTDRESVRRVDRAGRVTTIARGGLLALGSGRLAENHLCSLALAGDGAVFVSDRVTRRILKVGPAGEISGFAQNDDAWTPVSVNWTAGSLYVLEVDGEQTRTVRYDAQGRRQSLTALQESDRPVGDTRPAWLG